MKPFILSLFSFLMMINTASANICFPDEYGNVGDSALKILAQAKNDSRDILDIDTRYLSARNEYSRKFDEISERSKMASTQIEIERLNVEIANLNYDFCIQEVFEAEKKYTEIRNRNLNLDLKEINKTISNLNTWTRWCSREGKNVIANELSQMARNLLNFRDNESKKIAAKAETYIGFIDTLESCKKIFNINN